MRGSDVRTLQRDLTVTGFTTRVTGVFNQSTENHVIDFQRRYHLSVDGIVGPQTAGALRTQVARAEAAKRAPRRTTSSSTASTATADPATTSSTTTTSQTSPPATGGTTTTGGSSATPPPNDAPVEKATLNSEGLAVAPADAPEVIREVIAAANRIAFKPYVYGGGHASFNSSGYDCSGSVSYALHGGGLLSSPEDSSEFESYGDAGAGRWITIWTNAGHAYMNIAGLWFDTAAQSSANGNDRWSRTRISPSSGFMVRHPAGW